MRLIVGFAAGGAADVVARLMGQWLSERLGQSFIIKNRPGAGSNTAAEAVTKAPPDGYTLPHLTLSGHPAPIEDPHRACPLPATYLHCRHIWSMSR